MLMLSSTFLKIQNTVITALMSTQPLPVISVSVFTYFYFFICLTFNRCQTFYLIKMCWILLCSCKYS